MPLHIIREDITRMKVDAIVAAGSDMPGTPKPTGGVNGSIHRRAGEGLLQALRRLGGILPGKARVTRAFERPCRYVIHTAGPRWQGGGHGEADRLAACYREALQAAADMRLESIAFPLISTGKYGYPKAEAMQVAAGAIRAFLAENDMEVFLVVYDREAYMKGSEMFRDVRAFVDQHYVDAHYIRRGVSEEAWARCDVHDAAPLPERPYAAECEFPEPVSTRRTAPAETEEDAGKPDPGAERTDAGPRYPRAAKHSSLTRSAKKVKEEDGTPILGAAPPKPLAKSIPAASSALPPELQRRLSRLDEGFREMLLRLISERGMTDAECYHRANLDRKLFNKILNVENYRPKKPTVVALCVALRLDWTQTRQLVSRAGYSMSRSSCFDVIVEFFITRGEYDLDRINFALFDYDQPLLGSIEKSA